MNARQLSELVPHLELLDADLTFFLLRDELAAIRQAEGGQLRDLIGGEAAAAGTGGCAARRGSQHDSHGLLYGQQLLAGQRGGDVDRGKHSRSTTGRTLLTTMGALQRGLSIEFRLQAPSELFIGDEEVGRRGGAARSRGS
jgi:hypothetical protein